MKKIHKDKQGLKQETKSEIQELLDELFLDDLNEKISNVSTQTAGNLGALDDIKRQFTQNFNVICDEVDQVKQKLGCMGNEDEWGEENIISFLNQLVSILSSCKVGLQEQTKCLGTNWEEQTLHSVLNSLMTRIVEVKESVTQLEQNTFKSSFEKLYNEIKQIDGIIGKLQKIESEINFIKEALSNEGIVVDIANKQMEIAQSIKEGRIVIENLSNGLNEIKISIDSFLFSVIELQKKNETKLDDLFDRAKEKQEELESKLIEMEASIKRKSSMTFYGIGLLALTNVVIIFIQLLK